MKPLIGRVISLKMAKTATVQVSRIKIHPLYRKRIRQVKKFPVHNEIGASVGDQVEFRPTRPISKTKKWAITKIITEGKKK